MRTEFFARLDPFIEPRGLGEVMIGMDFQVGEATSRCPDVTFISNERPGGVDLAKVPLPAVPELAIEIVCNERADDLMKKVVQYLEAGVRFVWVFYPELGLAHRYVPGKAVLETFSAADNFTEPELLPGFALPLTEIFSLADQPPFMNA
jgi:Uma2 family endonuclease